MAYQGSYAVGDTVYWLFSTSVDGVPTVFSGSPALTVYKNSLTQSATGLTLTVDYDSVTGQNQVKIDTSASASFYTDETQYSVQISSGTVGGLSVIGRNIGSFSLSAETIHSVTGSTGSIVTGSGTSGSVPPRVIIPGNRS